MSKNKGENERRGTLVEINLSNNPKEAYIAGTGTMLGFGQEGTVYKGKDTKDNDVALKVSNNPETNKQLLVEFAMKKAMHKLLLQENKPSDIGRVNKVYEITRSTKEFITAPSNQENATEKNTEEVSVDTSPKVVFTMEVADGTVETLDSKDEEQVNEIEDFAITIQGFGFDLQQDVMRDQNLFHKNGKFQLGDCGGMKVIKNSRAEECFIKELNEARTKVNKGVEESDKIIIGEADFISYRSKGTDEQMTQKELNVKAVEARKERDEGRQEFANRKKNPTVKVAKDNTKKDKLNAFLKKNVQNENSVQDSQKTSHAQRISRSSSYAETVISDKENNGPSRI